MELCTTQPISNPPQTRRRHNHHRFLTANPFRLHSPTVYLLPLKQQQSTHAFCFGLRTHSRATSDDASNEPNRATSDDASNEPNRYLDERDGVTVTTLEEDSITQKVYGESFSGKELEENSAKDDKAQSFEFLDNLNIKVDSGDTYALLSYGGGALLTLWLASAVVGSINTIPLFPQMMEVVGLGYSFWFTTRYLLFKKNREELATKIEQLKQQVFGSIDD